MTRRGSLALLLCAILVAGCKPSAEQKPPHATEVPAGYRRIDLQGFTLDVPAGFEEVEQMPPESDLEWLAYLADGGAPGSPHILFARHIKPADFPSRVYGLTAMERLSKAGDKRVVDSRQHEVGPLEVTDLEVVVGNSPRHVHWRRLFVHQGRAYALTYSVAEQQAEEVRSQAQTVVSSLRTADQPQ